MFSVGQTVYHKTGRHTGKVIEIDGDTVYLMQPNGVEIEFRRDELTAAPAGDPAPRTRTIVTASPTNARPPAASTEVPASVLARKLTANDITPEHQKVLACIPQRTMHTIASLFERQQIGRFSGLSVAQKLNFIAEVTAVPYIKMKQFSDQPSTLGLMMARELSVRLGTAK